MPLIRVSQPFSDQLPTQRSARRLLLGAFDMFHSSRRKRAGTSPSEVVSSSALEGHILVTGAAGSGADTFASLAVRHALESGASFLFLDDMEDEETYTDLAHQAQRYGRSAVGVLAQTARFTESIGELADRLKSGLAEYTGLYLPAYADGLIEDRPALRRLEALLTVLQGRVGPDLPPLVIVLKEVGKYPKDRLEEFFTLASRTNLKVVATDRSPLVLLSELQQHFETRVFFKQSARLSEEELTSCLRFASSPKTDLAEDAVEVSCDVLRSFDVGMCLISTPQEVFYAQVQPDR